MMRKIDALRRRYAAPLAVLCALMLAYAAPYLVPVNPDSAVMRSGSLGALLILAAIFPAHDALKRRSLRAIVHALIFSLIFALCLGLGSELAVYDGLLPGMGSLVRRFAVPVLAAPMLALVLVPVFEFVPKIKAKPIPRIPFIAFFALFTVCYGAVMLAMYPGVVAYDFEHEIAQFTSGVYNAAHPVAHTLFLGSLYTIGEAIFGSMTAGAATYSVAQLVLLAAMYAWACCFVQKRIRSLTLTLALAAAFALLPFHGVIAISTAKDPLFAGLCTVLVLLLWEIAEDPDAFLASKFRTIRFGAVCLLMALLRHNGVFAFAPACLALIVFCKGKRRRAMIVAALSLAACALVPKGFEFAVHAQKAPSSEMMSVPCQQLMRTAARADGLTPEEYDEIAAWFSDAIDRYRPHCADPAKGGNFDFARYQKDPGAYWDLYFKYAARYPRIYIEAFLQNCAGIWNPDDISHAKAMGGEQYDYVYMNTVYFYEDGRYDIHPDSKLPGLQKMLYSFTHHADHEDTMLLAQLFCPAVYVFMLLLTSLILGCQRRARLILCTLPLWGIAASLLFSAGIFVRYAYPVMAAAPLLLILALRARYAQSDA